MKGVLNLFSWVASGLIEGLCPGSALVDGIAEELKRYRESATKVGENMQQAWQESLRTLEAALGGGGWVAPKSRKQFAEKFVKEVITPFAVKNNIIGGRLESFLNKSLEQCQQLIEMDSDLINFTNFDEKVLLDALSQATPASAEEMETLIIDRIQSRLPNAKELLQLLWHRNLLLEGLVAHFQFMLSQNPNLADIVAHMDRQRIQQDLILIKDRMQAALKSNELTDIGGLGNRISQLATTDELYRLQNDYRGLFGMLFEKVDRLSDDHVEINHKLDQILTTLEDLKQLQQLRAVNSKIQPELPLERPNLQEMKLADQLNTMIKEFGWEALPEHKRDCTANSLAISFYSSQKICQALTVLEDAINHNAQSPEIYFNYFQALQAAGSYDKAVDAYNRAVAGNPHLALFPADKYRMTGIIGKGGMGVVYKAKLLASDTDVAIKVLLLPEEWYPGARNRFLQAAKTAASLKHPNIVTIYDFESCQPDYPCMVMEYLEGIDLQRRVKEQGPFNVGDGLQIVRAIAQGLAYAHDEGVVHRDLKPGNIVLTAKGPKIIDFGLAKWERDSTLTLTGEVFYTLYYSSPEQRIDFHGVDQRSDIYSFGKTLYYLFTGEEPYDIDWQEVPVILRPILQKATRKKPSTRYANMKEMIHDIDRAMEGEFADSNGYETGEWEQMPRLALIDVPASTPPDDVLARLPKDCVIHEKGTIITNQDQAPMVYVPAGVFLMGDDSDRADYDEAPVHEVYLDAYLIDVYPVSNMRYRMFLERLDKYANHPSPWCHPDEPRNKVHIPQFWYSSKWNQDDHPVVGVDWWDAYAYCKWAGKDLPTEAEWEKSARGVDGRVYPWGNELPTPNICNYDNYYKMTTPVQKFQQDRSPYGCSNMAGNVWEWCLDWFDPTYYKKSASENPIGPPNGRCRVGRGGSWMNDARRIRTTTRAHGTGPGDRNHHLGFRAVKRLG